MQFSLKDIWTMVVPVALAILFVSYAALRANTIPFTWDEAYTFLHHVRFGKLIQHDFGPMAANHHLLNVWGMVAAHKLFGTGELAMRLPNVLAALLYSMVTMFVVSKANDGYARVGCALVLLAHPYMLDWFSLARGYGLGMAFMAASLTAAWSFSSSHRIVHASVALFCAICAAASNFLFLNFLVALSAILILFVAFRKPFSIAHLLIVSGLSALGMALLVPIAANLNGSGAFYFGASNAWGALTTLINNATYNHTYYPSPIAIVLLVLVSFALLFGLSKTMRSVLSRKPLPRHTVGWGVLLVWLTAVGVQHWLLGSPWPQGRTAVAFIPLLAFSIVFIFQETQRWPILNKALLGGMALILLLNQARAFNVEYVLDWPSSSGSKQAIAALLLDQRGNSEIHPATTFTCAFLSAEPMAYYQQTGHLPNTWVRPHQAGLQPQRSDYYFLEVPELPQFDTTHWTRIFSHRASRTVLFRNDFNFLPKHHLVFASPEVAPSDSIRFNAQDSLHQERPYVFSDSTSIKRPWIVISSEGKAGFEDDWITTIIEIKRGTRILETRMIRTRNQTTKNLWEDQSFCFGPDSALQIGDSLLVRSVNATRRRVQFLRPLKLQVYWMEE